MLIAEVFSTVLTWFYAVVQTFLDYGGYLGFALLLFPLLRKVCYLFKQFTN